jgi:hypothetical protein
MTIEHNLNVPPINVPIADLRSLVVTTGQLQQGMESLTGTRGDPADRACTLRDLIKLGLVSMADLEAALK